MENIKIDSITCGIKYTLFLSNYGNIYSCGDNRFGQLGVGYENICETIIKKVKNNEKFKQIHANNQSDTSFAVTELTNVMFGKILTNVWKRNITIRRQKHNLIQ